MTDYKLKEWPEKEAQDSAIRVLLETLEFMGYRGVRRMGDTIIVHKFLPHLGKKRCWVKMVLSIDSVTTGRLEGLDMHDRRKTFDDSFPRGIKESD